MTIAKEMKLSSAGKLFEVQRLRQILGLTTFEKEEEILIDESLNFKHFMSFNQFIETLKLPSNNTTLQLFKLFEEVIHSNVFHQYLIFPELTSVFFFLLLF